MSNEAKKVMLYNKGQRTIHIDGEFKPSTSRDFSVEVAERVLRLFPEEVFKTNSVEFVDQSAPALKKEIEEHNLTKKQLKELKAKQDGLKKESTDLDL